MRAETELQAPRTENRAANRTAKRDRTRWILTAVGLSVLFHFSLLLIQSGERPEPEAGTELTVLLQRQDVDQAASEVVQPPETPPEPIQPEDPRPGPTAQVDSNPADAAEERQQVPTQAETANVASDKSPPRPLLSTRLLATVRENLGKPAGPEAGDATTPARIPALPDPLSWINQYVGRVEPSREVRQNRDGSRQARVVTEDGQILCGKADAPTAAEIFNPSLATNLMRWRDCGRRRPDLPDLSDPRLRTPRPSP